MIDGNFEYSDQMTSEDKIDEFIKSMELEKNIVNTVKSSTISDLEDNILKLGFKKVFELEDITWFIYKDDKYVLVLNHNELHLYEKEIELYFNHK